MRKLLVLSLGLVLGLVSCSPMQFAVRVDMRDQSKTRIPLEGKSISVTYLDGGQDSVSVFLEGVAQGFAVALEQDYFAGKESIGIFRAGKQEGVDMTSRENMVSTVVETGVDVAFVFDLESVGDLRTQVTDVPFEVRVYVYDAMNQRDTVQMFRGSSSIKPALSVASQGYDVGRRSAGIFLPEWNTQVFRFYCFYSDDWYDAWYLADDCEFVKAIDIWMKLASTGNTYKRSCAEYNIALACYIMGDKELAAQWLDRSDADYVLADSYNLRSKLK